ncbi:MAG TPA: hypothetical protein PL119_02060, partial [Bacteroidales bacterium]|nr:hypothetical protein [Bacteroidales bacterium]
DATAEMTLIEAPGLRAEALAIALLLREAAETGRTAALITPDRMLTQKAIPKGNKTQGNQPQEIQGPAKQVPHLALRIHAQRPTGWLPLPFPNVHMARAASEKPQAGKKAQQQQQREKSQNPEPKPQPRIKYQTRPQRPLQA